MAETAIVEYTSKAIRSRPLGNPNIIRTMIGVPEILLQIGSALPGTMDLDTRRTKARALLEQFFLHIVNSKGLANICACTGDSVVQCITEMASVDLSPTKVGGECYAVPLKGICTCWIGYRGFVKLIVNTGAVSGVEAVLVYEGEQFDWFRDEGGAHWTHKPNLDLQGNAAKVKAAYAVGYIKGGPPIFEVMNIGQLKNIRQSSKMSDSPAYRGWLTEMYRKAPIRRLQKFVPKQSDNLAQRILEKALEMDNRSHTLEDIAENRKILDAHSRTMLTAEEKPIEQAETPPEAPEPERAEDGTVLPPEFT